MRRAKCFPSAPARQWRRWSARAFASNGRAVDECFWPVGQFTDSGWHHLAVVCENAALRRCYLDGIDLGQNTKLWSNDTRNRARWTLGRIENQHFTDEAPWSGDMDDVRLYGRALTAEEITALARYSG